MKEELILLGTGNATVTKCFNTCFAIKKGEEYWMLDCDWMELNSSINVAENNGSISSTQAWYLREKYLGMTKEDNCG